MNLNGVPTMYIHSVEGYIVRSSIYTLKPTITDSKTRLT